MDRPRAMEIGGQFAETTELRDGRLLLTYVRRNDDPSIRLRFGNANDWSWDEHDALVIHTRNQEDLIRARESSYGEYLRNMSTWSFGWPSPLELADGKLLLAYYIGIDHFSAVRIACIAEV